MVGGLPQEIGVPIVGEIEDKKQLDIEEGSKEVLIKGEGKTIITKNKSIKRIYFK